MAKPEPQVPSVGRIVHVDDRGTCYPAMITAVRGELLSLSVFRPGHARLTVLEDVGDSSWHWPERT